MNHPLYQGSALDLREADFVLVLEADVPWIPGGNAPLENAYIAVLDSDPIKSHIATYEFTADTRMRTDTLRTLEALCAKISEIMRDSDRAGFATRASDWAERSRQRTMKDEEAALSVAKNTPISPLAELPTRKAIRRQLSRDRRDSYAQSSSSLSEVVGGGQLLSQPRKRRGLGGRSSIWR